LLSGTTLAPWAAPFVGSHGTQRGRGSGEEKEVGERETPEIQIGREDDD